jgi:hypothetical protein
MHDADHVVSARTDKVGQRIRKPFFIIGDENAHTITAEDFVPTAEKYFLAHQAGS